MIDTTKLRQLCYTKGVEVNKKITNDADYVQLRVILNQIIENINRLDMLHELGHTASVERLENQVNEQLYKFDQKFLLGCLRST